LGVPESVVPTPAPGQLFSGTLGPESTAGIHGKPYGGSFARDTSSKAAVSLPTYGQGIESEIPDIIAALINKTLGGKPIYDPYWTLTVLGGSLQPLDSVTQASPVLAANPNIPSNILEWTGPSTIKASYTIVNQGLLDEDNNIMFVFAILLGAAGAGMLASLQGIIHVLSSRSVSSDKTRDDSECPPKAAT
jgi:hypothetical protein